MAFATRLGTVTSLLATAAKDGGDAAWAEIAQSEELPEQFGALRFQFGNGQSHEGTSF